MVELAQGAKACACGLAGLAGLVALQVEDILIRCPRAQGGCVRIVPAVPAVPGFPIAAAMVASD